MLGRLQGIVAETRDVVSCLDASALHPDTAARYLDEFVALERLAVAGRTLVAERAAMGNDRRRSGSRSDEDWLSQRTGTTYRDAASTLETSAKLEDLPQLDSALRKGELSAPKLAELGPAATPENEARLVDAAKTDNVRQLKKRCEEERRRASSVEDEERRAARQHRERFFRSWTDHDGAWRCEGMAPAAAGARIDAVVAAALEKVFKQARAEGRRESSDNYRFDAFEELICEGTGGGVATEVIIRVDAERLAGGEGRCEAVGVGTIPVSEVIGKLFAGAYVKVLASDGVDVTSVVHLGRRIPAEISAAIRERDNFLCVRPGCGSSHRLELHHFRTDYAESKVSGYVELATLCKADHDLITYGGHRLSGGPGRWKWILPP
jgi:hypothetical protein